MESLRKVLQEYSGSPVTMGSTSGPKKSEVINREGLKDGLTALSQRNEKYFIIGIVMAAVLFAALIVVGFVQLNNPASLKAVPPIFGSSAALVVWKMFKTWREKSYTDCVLALVPNVDDETLRSIVAVLVKKI
jgi:hypothetical protein